MEEIWKPLFGYEISYHVSSLGNFKSLPRNGTKLNGKVLSPVMSPYGYLLICLHQNGVQKTERVHRMVAKARTMEEIWKDVQGYEGYYKVSNLGRVKLLFGKRIKKHLNHERLYNNQNSWTWAKGFRAYKTRLTAMERC